jgi:ABC-type antimicrobial peptide transport system permease subunit
MGASRGRLIRQLLSESIFLASIGAAMGVCLAYFATRVLSNIQLPLSIPMRLDFTPDMKVLWMTAGVTVLTGLMFGTLPAIRATKPNLIQALKGELTGLGLHMSRKISMNNLSQLV